MESPACAFPAKGKSINAETNMLTTEALKLMYFSLHIPGD
jgi:hypothetical protein